MIASISRCAKTIKSQNIRQSYSSTATPLSCGTVVARLRRFSPRVEALVAKHLNRTASAENPCS